MQHRSHRGPAFALAAVALLALPTAAEIAFVQDVRFLGATQGNTVLMLSDMDEFGQGVASVPDLDGDGIDELAVSVPMHDLDAAAGRVENGAVWILFLAPDGSIASGVRITEGEGGLTLTVPDYMLYGSAVAALGDLDGDGLQEIAVGAAGVESGTSPFGFVDVLSLQPDGTVADARRIDVNDPALQGTFQGNDRFGRSVACIGDVDGDGIADLAVGGPSTFFIGRNGQVWILFLRADGSVREAHVLDESALVAAGAVSSTFEHIGQAVAPLGDLDGDGRLEVAVSDPDAFSANGLLSGVVFVLSLEPDGSIGRLVQVEEGSGGFGGDLGISEDFGDGLANLGDLDGDGLPELAVGATADDDGSTDYGAVWILSFSRKGLVTSWEKISQTQGGLGAQGGGEADFGRGIALLPDSDGDGLPTLAVGAPRSNVGGFRIGQLFLLEIGPTDPAAAFRADGVLAGRPPLSVSFTDLSQGSTVGDWTWDFGDGSTSTEQSPTHVYSVKGTFDVTLQVSGRDGTSAVTKVGLVCVDTSASAVERDGSGANPAVFHPAGTPVLGASWFATVDAAAVGATGFAGALVYAEPLEGLFLAYGEVLVDPTSALLGAQSAAVVLGSATLVFPIPSDLALLGFQGSAQAFVLGPVRLTNAIDLILGDS